MPFKATVGVASPETSEFEDIDAVVDTGAGHSFLPASFLESLGVPRTRTRGFKLADGTRKTYDMGEARFRIEGREMNSPVVFGDDDVCLLGATTLEVFDLIADTTNLRLIEAPEPCWSASFAADIARPRRRDPDRSAAYPSWGGPRTLHWTGRRKFLTTLLCSTICVHPVLDAKTYVCVPCQHHNSGDRTLMSAAHSQSERPVQEFDRGRALGRLKATRSDGERDGAIADIIGEAVDETNSNYEAIKAWWKQIDERLSEHDKRFDDHDKRFDDIDRELDGIKKQLSELLAMGGIFAGNPDAHEFKIGSLALGPNGGAFGLCSGCGWQRVGKAQEDLEPLHRAHVEEVRVVVADF